MLYEIKMLRRHWTANIHPMANIYESNQEPLFHISSSTVKTSSVSRSCFSAFEVDGPAPPVEATRTA